MNSAGPLNIEQLLSLVDRLQSVIREISAREHRLKHEWTADESDLRRLTREAVEAVQTRLADELAAERGEVRRLCEELEQRARARAVRIETAHEGVWLAAIAEVDGREGRRRDKLQMAAMRARRKLAEEQAAAAEVLGRRMTVLAGVHARTTEIRCAAIDALRAFADILDAPGRETVALPDADADVEALIAAAEAELDRLADQVAHYREPALARIFRYLPIEAAIPGLLVVHGVWLFLQHRWAPFSGLVVMVGVSAAVTLGAVVALFLAGRRRSRQGGKRMGQTLARIRLGYNAAMRRSRIDREEANARAVHACRTMEAMLEKEWDAPLMTVEQHRLERVKARSTADARAERMLREHRERVRRDRGRLDTRLDNSLERLRVVAQVETERLQREIGRQEDALAGRQTAERAALVAEWKAEVEPVYEGLQSAIDASAAHFPAWDADLWHDWQPGTQFARCALAARLEVDVARLGEGLPQTPALALPGPSRFALPVALTFPEHGSLLIETQQGAGDEAIATLNAVIFRLLASTSPAKLRFTLFDPVELGQSFAGIMHLADFEESLVGTRIWTQSSEFEEQLGELNEHMEKIIQMYLRNEYATIAEYNEQAGDLSESYHFLVVANFPANFSDTAARRLLSIAASGARCGVYTLIHWDPRWPLPSGIDREVLRRHSLGISVSDSGCKLAGRSVRGQTLVLETPPERELANRLLLTVGEQHARRQRVEVAFEQVVPPATALWSGDASTELRVPVGRTGATKLCCLELGRGMRQHALIAGKTGSGKSTLFHVIITNLALWYGPDEVEFYLVDFKKGVEFKCYANGDLPHARVVAIESDRDFGLSVLQALDRELQRRGQCFRERDVQDLAGYRRVAGRSSMSRILLIIDEFQEFFVDDDRIAQSAALLLDRIVRQGRAFGMHVMLGSQTLGGAYSLARTTLGQMVVRIALQCNESDAYLIMDDGNAAPRLLSRPGEAIYNDAAGAADGNVPFQVVWLPDETRTGWLRRVREHAQQHGVARAAPVVFEGRAPADVRGNQCLADAMAAVPDGKPDAAQAWLGAPNSIRGPLGACFNRRSGSHLLMVGQNEEALFAMLCTSWVSLAAQYAPGHVRFVVLDNYGADVQERRTLERIAACMPHDTVWGRGAEAADAVVQLAASCRAAEHASGERPDVYLIIPELQKHRSLRHREAYDFGLDESDAKASAPQALSELVAEGAPEGLHVLASCDTFGSATRMLGRRALGGFGMRVALQMGINDSAGLIDSPDAGRLGLFRAILFHEAESRYETFRPYAMPDDDWFDELSQGFRAR